MPECFLSLEFRLNTVKNCACVALCNVSRYVTKSRDMRESDLVREMFFRTVLLQSADMLYDRRCL